MQRLMCVAALTCVAACATPAPEKPAPRPPRAANAKLSLEEAHAVVADFEARQAGESASDPLNQPKSLDNVFEILKRDQLDLFPAGVAFASKAEGPKAEALRAQIELAWGEAQQLLGEVFSDVNGQLRRTVHELEIRSASGELSEKGRERLDNLQAALEKSDGLAAALDRLAEEHIATGARLAREVIAKNPTDYVGYRVAADYSRLRGDWGPFEELLRKIEAANPGSNGLVFLKGCAALGRDGNQAEAVKLFREALDKDPQFTRAQVQLVLARTGVRDTYAEYQKLRALNPHHQIVVWAGDALTQAFEASRSRP